MMKKRVMWGVFWCVYGLVGIWCVGALWYAFVHALWLRVLLAGIFALAWAVCPWWPKIRRWGVGAVVLTEVAVIVAFAAIPATDDQIWEPSFARIPQAEFNRPYPGWVTVHDIRNFTYRTETDFDVEYKSEVFDLDTVESVDFIVVHWGVEAIAHTMLSFGFSTGQRLVVSVETRKPVGADQDLLAGFFKAYQLAMLMGTERDLIGLRTNYRVGEELRIYPTTTLPFECRTMLANLLFQANTLARHPKFYNTISANCTNTLVPSMRRTWNLESARSVVLNGWVDQMAFEAGWLAGAKENESFESYRQRHTANQFVQGLTSIPSDYSSLIRKGF